MENIWWAKDQGEAKTAAYIQGQWHRVSPHSMYKAEKSLKRAHDLIMVYSFPALPKNNFWKLATIKGNKHLHLFFQEECIKNYLVLISCLQYALTASISPLVPKNLLYSCGRRAISISWSDFPFVSITFLFTKTTAIAQKVANMEYNRCGPSCSSKRKNISPTKKFTT